MLNFWVFVLLSSLKIKTQTKNTLIFCDNYFFKYLHETKFAYLYNLKAWKNCIFKIFKFYSGYTVILKLVGHFSLLLLIPATTPLKAPISIKLMVGQSNAPQCSIRVGIPLSQNTYKPSQDLGEAALKIGSTVCEILRYTRNQKYIERPY